MNRVLSPDCAQPSCSYAPTELHRQHFGVHRQAAPLGRFRGQLAPLQSCSRKQRRIHLQTVHVITPARTDQQVGSPLTTLAVAQPSINPEELLASISSPVALDLDVLNRNLRNIGGGRHPMLTAAAEQIFGAGGKKLRPLIVFLVARATAKQTGLRDINDKHRRIAEITEMLHTASLVHDDVLDECNIRRGAKTVNSMFGNRVAVLAGDFLFAQSSWELANLENMEVIKLISQVIADFANGEISQAASLFDTHVTLEQYLDKSFYKTASLMAAGCRCAAVFSEVSTEMKQAMYDYGKHLGLAFQVVDDILDFTQSTEQLGKPQGQDLASGNLTAPAIFALQKEPRLRELVESEFVEPGSLQAALKLVEASGGLDMARDLARSEGDLALKCLEDLPDCPAKQSLQLMVNYVLKRLH